MNFALVFISLTLSACLVTGQNNSSTSTTELPTTVMTTLLGTTTESVATSTAVEATTAANVTTTAEAITTNATNETSTTVAVNATTVTETTMQAVTTTATPVDPSVYTYKVYDDTTGKACLLAQMKIGLTVSYNTTKNTTEVQQIHPFHADEYEVNVTGQCWTNETKTAMMTLTITDKATLVPNTTAATDRLVVFFAEGEKANINMVQYNVTLNARRFPDAKDTNLSLTNDEFGLVLSDPTKYYQCKSSQTKNIQDGSKITLEDMKVQAFHVVNGSYGNGVICSLDVPTTQAPIMTTAGTIGTTTPLPDVPTPLPVSVKQDNVTCIYGSVGIRIDITYEKGAERTRTAKSVDVPVGNSTTIRGVCGNVTQTLNISFFGTWWIQLSFSKPSTAMLGASNSFECDQILLHYVLDENFDDPSNPGREMMANGTDLGLFKAEVGNYYKCASKEKVSIGENVTIDTTGVEIQAFRTQPGNGLVGNAQDCADDDKTSDIVPIAVGAALAGLVVIVLIAYLIGRRKNHRGYQSV